jgi:hypothetical protein
MADLAAKGNDAGAAASGEPVLKRARLPSDALAMHDAHEEAEDEQAEEMGEAEAGEEVGAAPGEEGAPLGKIAKVRKPKRERRLDKKENRKRAKEAKAARPQEHHEAHEAACPDEDARPKTKIGAEMVQEAQPFVDGIYRRILPYEYVFKTFAKGRWVGMGLLELFQTEFHAETPEFYKQAIVDGRVILSGQRALPSTVIKNNDVIEHRVHRHEPPVTSAPIKIIHEDER